MKGRTVLASLLCILAAEITAVFLLANGDRENNQDAVLVNEVLRSVEAGWSDLENYENHTKLHFTVLDLNGTVLYKTKDSLSESINAAVIHRDTVLDVQGDDFIVGKIIIYNDSDRTFQLWRKKLVMALFAGIILQAAVSGVYLIYINYAVIKPFQKLKNFAQRVAGGNFDIPLEMDRGNIFGSFTESFDILRAELKKAKREEAEANESKKELVAKLSHDIKTPVASIKAASEVGMALTDNKKLQDNYSQIIQKSDQINALITNLFTATLEELRQLPVILEDMESRELKKLLENADYLRRAVIPEAPDCILYVDRLRLQQIFDNIFVNSYKYAGTSIQVEICRKQKGLSICIEDAGGGVPTEELLFIKEKFKRGSNAGNIEGAGLGLYISDYFMREMYGDLIIENGTGGLRVEVVLPLSGHSGK